MKKAEERLNLELFQNVSVHKFYRLKTLITLEQVNITEWLKKKRRILISKIVMVGTHVQYAQTDTTRQTDGPWYDWYHSKTGKFWSLMFVSEKESHNRKCEKRDGTEL